MEKGFDVATPAKVEQRLSDWRKCGDKVAEYFSVELNSRAHGSGRHHTPIKIVFNREAPFLERLVNSYFQEVEMFKSRHGFKPGELANEAKRATLVIKTLKDADVYELFSIKPSLNRTDIPALLKLHFTLQLCCMFTLVKIDDLSKDVRNLLEYCLIHAEEYSESWVCLSMTLLRRCFENSPVNR